MSPEPVAVVGFAWSPQAHQVKDFLARSRVPYRWLNYESAPEGRRLVEELGLSTEDLPVLRFPDGGVLASPTDEQLAERIGLSTEAESPFYDLIVVGAGPAGLSAAVYAASEGLRTLVLEAEAPGGQAGASAGIENYLGFPEGLAGGELGRRAVAQAERFGAEVIVASRATALRAVDPYRVVTVEGGTEIFSHAVLLATGVSWRLLKAPGCDRLIGRGIYYGAAASEVASCHDEDVYLIGGGNSAGQAAVLLARYARAVTLVAPEPSFEERMSQYLLERIRTTPNVRLRAGTRVTNATGRDHLDSITLEDVETGETEEVSTHVVFVFIGAQPDTGWLAETVALDGDGFILSGEEATRDGWPLERSPFPLETSLPGVFTAGDGRSGSVPRVGAAVGEGAGAVQYVHAYLRES